MAETQEAMYLALSTTMCVGERGQVLSHQKSKGRRIATSMDCYDGFVLHLPSQSSVALKHR